MADGRGALVEALIWDVRSDVGSPWDQEVPVPRSTIERETAALTSQALTTTANRSLVGILNEFVHLADAWRHPDGHNDLDDLSLHLAQVPCSPLYQRHVSPDHELAALLTHPQPG